MDLVRGQKIDYREIETAGIVISLYCLSFLGLLIIVNSAQEKGKIKVPTIGLNIVEVFAFCVFLIIVSSTVGYLYSEDVFTNKEFGWQIGIYEVEDPYNLDFADSDVVNPVLTKDSVTDIEASFVADPFLIDHGTEVLMFLEVLNADSEHGDIALARSTNGLDWEYDRVVLDEDFHLSYPLVFKEDDVHYMIPETGEKEQIRLYRSNNFPYEWELDTILLEGMKFKDPTLLISNGTYFIFAETRSNEELRLFYSDTLRGTWQEHPQSPVIENNPDHARCAGRILQIDNRTIRYAQDDYPVYGLQIWGFEITTINKFEYSETMIGTKPLLTGFDDWNPDGAHHIDMLQTHTGKWIAVVDGR